MADVALAWLALFAWAMATFTTLEHVCPRRHVPVGAQRIATSGALLAIDIAIARQVIHAADDPGLLRTADLRTGVSGDVDPHARFAVAGVHSTPRRGVGARGP